MSTGLPVAQLKPESSFNYEAAARYRTDRVAADAAFFVNQIRSAIRKQALILPPGAVGREIGGTTIVFQNAGGAVFVTEASNPVLVRANSGDARISGIEQRCRLSRAWSLGSAFTYLRASDPATGLPPDIEGGTPAPDAYLKVRYGSLGNRFWIEPYIHAAGRQARLSTLDLEDRRTGASRSRQSIRNFFLNGAPAHGLVGAGPDGIFQTGDDRLLATGETLSQVLDRVLGPGVESAPLFRAVPGYVTFNVRARFRIAERHGVLLDFANIGDRSYRGISWGMDAPGRGLFLRYRTTF